MKLLSPVILLWVWASALTTGNKVETMESAVDYLTRFGYVSEASRPTVLETLQDGNMDPLQTAIQQYQRTFSLPVTGLLDEATLEFMNKPRCGLPDDGIVASENTPKRSRRYALAGNKWPKTELTYFIEQWTTDLPRAVVEREIRRAFDSWSAVSALRFYRVNNRAADIIIKFGARSHGDPYPFDGSGGTLAHAFYPSSGGDAHFDEDETWTIRTYQGINLYQVAVHEFGHSLGIRHTNIRGAIMFPAYTGYRADAGLHRDDIDAVRALYGASRALPTTTTRPTTSTRASAGGSDVCSVSGWDAVLTTLNGKTYFFKDEYYYEQGDPKARLVTDDWAGIRGRVDAALTLSSGYSLLIQGENFWVFRDQNRYDYTVRKIGNYFGMLAREVDAAWTWTRDKTFYLVKDGQVWRNNNDYRLDRNYPRTFDAEFRGAPHNIDAATSDANGKTHFFVGAHYYTLDDNSMSVSGSGRLIAADWFGCESSRLLHKAPVAVGPEDQHMQEEKRQFENMLNDKDLDLSSSSSSAIRSTLSLFVILLLRSMLF